MRHQVPLASQACDFMCKQNRDLHSVGYKKIVSIPVPAVTKGLRIQTQFGQERLVSITDNKSKRF